MREMLES